MKNRDHDILEMRNAGKTFQEIGTEHGISATRARQCFYAAANKLKRQMETKWTDGLSTKIANALISAGFACKEQVIDCLHSGNIDLIPNIGKHSIREISTWAGVTTHFAQLEITKAIKLLESHGYKVIPNTLS